MENVFSDSFTDVTVTEYPDDTLKLVRFAATDIAGNSKVNCNPWQKIKFCVNDTEYRHYTPVSFNKDNRSGEVLFYLLQKGPVSRWTEQLTTGARLKMIGPGGKMQYRLNSGLHINFGYETSPDLFGSIHERATAEKQNCYCFAAVHLTDRDQFCFYLTGNTRSIQAFQYNILSPGSKNGQIQTGPYWTEEKRGLLDN